jgi:fucose permease
LGSGKSSNIKEHDMATIILIIIYVAFISLGLPDGMLGAAWPTMETEFKVPLGYAGIISSMISVGTIVSSMFSVKVLLRFGTGRVTMFSILLTGVGLLGFALTPSFWIIYLCAIPLGIGAGAVDSGLNAYIAEHYKASHMNFLHAFWGIGALSGPLIMSAFIGSDGNWRLGYLTVAIVQLILALVFVLSLSLWRKVESAHQNASRSNDIAADLTAEGRRNKSLLSAMRVKGVKEVLICFVMYIGIEATLGLWGATYLVHVRNFDPVRAAAWTSIFYGGLTLGRLLCGFLAIKLSNKLLIRIGETLISAGVAGMLLGQFLAGSDLLTLAGFILTGLGSAPIFPAMLHETPVRFGQENAQAVMGFQMAVAYTSTTLLPPFFGWMATVASPMLLPWFLAVYIGVLFLLSERVNLVFSAKNQASG